MLPSEAPSGFAGSGLVEGLLVLLLTIASQVVPSKRTEPSMDAPRVVLPAGQGHPSRRDP